MKLQQRIIFVLFGTIFFIVGIFVFNSMNEKKNICTEEVVATISDIEVVRNSHSSSQRNDKSYDVYIQYEYDNNTYNELLTYYDASMYVGKELTIYVDPNHPTNIYTGGMQILPLIFCFIGLIAAIVGLFAGRSRNSNYSKKENSYDDYHIHSSSMEDRLKNL